jgi:hypothetical protein
MNICVCSSSCWLCLRKILEALLCMESCVCGGDVMLVQQPLLALSVKTDPASLLVYGSLCVLQMFCCSMLRSQRHVNTAVCGCRGVGFHQIYVVCSCRTAGRSTAVCA